MTGRRRAELVRPYVVTGGRAHPSRNTVDLVTVVRVTADKPLGALGPEQRDVVVLCRGGALTVADVAAYVRLPVSVTKVLIADLVDSGYLTIRAPIPKAELPDTELLQEVLNGLHRLRA